MGAEVSYLEGDLELKYISYALLFYRIFSDTLYLFVTINEGLGKVVLLGFLSFGSIIRMHRVFHIS